MGSLSIWHWLIVLLVVALVFGTKKLRNVGEDLGTAVKGFKKGLGDADEENAKPTTQANSIEDTKPVQNVAAEDVEFTEVKDNNKPTA